MSNNQSYSIKDEASVFVITHKDIPIPVIEGYIPLLVGAEAHPELSKKYLCDNIGDNISGLNDSYCELTGLYWIWKNIQTDYIGLVHYRRFFANIKRVCKIKEVYYSFGDPAYKIYTIRELKELLADQDLLVVKSPRLPISVRETLAGIGDEVWENLDLTIYKTYPELYITYKKYCKRKSHVQCNMFFGKKSVIDNYCEWVFPLLQEVDKIHKDKTGQRYKHREIGYLAELLFGLYIEINIIKSNYIDCIVTDENTSDYHRIKSILWLPVDIVKYMYMEIEWRVGKLERE